MLDASFVFDKDTPHNYQLELKHDRDWRNSRKRVLIILQTVSTEDLKANELVSTPGLIHCIKYAREHARKIVPDVSSASFAVGNFNARKHLHLKGTARSDAEAEFRVRCLKLIKKLDPTHILFSGDLNKLYPTTYAQFKNGWVHKIEGRRVTSTLDFSRLTEKMGLHANLLGFWCRHLSFLLIGKLPFSQCPETNPFYVNTIAKFDKAMAVFDADKLIAVDTETKNLTVNRNRIYTLQFAPSADPTTGYIIPVDHPHVKNPFTVEERKYIKRELKKRFGAPRFDKQLITFNGSFDLRILRQCLKLDIIYMPVYEIMAGEHLLDENVSALTTVGVRYKKMGSGGLAPTLCRYGCDFYLRDDNSFSKDDRTTIGSISPNDPGFKKYGSMDVTSLHFLRDCQIRASAWQDISGKVYTPIFERHMLYQMSDTVHQLSHLKQAGSLIDKRYLKSLLKPDSVLAKAVAELMDEFKTFPEVKAANKALLDASGFKAGNLFAAIGGKSTTGSQWVFSFSKPAHKVKLFIEQMKLEALQLTKTGQPQIDTEFIDHYKDRNFLVAKFGEFQAASKLLSTYVRGWYKKLTREIDGALDDHLRPDYKFFDVDTGRLASGGPNLQNIPTRGKLSKIIKEMFITADGHLLIRFDYSAHEVRGWSIMAKDTVLAAAFIAGQKLRQLFIRQHPPTLDYKFPLKDEDLKAIKAAKPTKLQKAVLATHELAVKLKKEGDVHIQNVFRFFGKWIEKSDPLRDAIKGVVFGTLYGKSAKTLGHDTKRAEIEAVKAKINTAHKAGDKKALALAEAEYMNLLEEDRTEYAQGIIDKMFTEFKRGKQWVDRMIDSATNRFYVFSPIGRVRHLFAAMLQDRRILGRQVRRGMNAPGQGFASEIAVKASRRVMVTYYSELPRFIRMLDLEGKYPIKFNRIVHDALYFTVPYEMVLPFMYILQYDATYGITKAYKEEFGHDFTVEPEIEMEVGVKDTLSHKWNWAIPQLKADFEASVDEGIKLGLLTAEKSEIMEKLLAPWHNKKLLAYLDKKYPMLGVSTADKVEEMLEHA